MRELATGRKRRVRIANAGGRWRKRAAPSVAGTRRRFGLSRQGHNVSLLPAQIRRAGLDPPIGEQSLRMLQLPKFVPLSDTKQPIRFKRRVKTRPTSYEKFQPALRVARTRTAAVALCARLGPQTIIHPQHPFHRLRPWRTVCGGGRCNEAKWRGRISARSRRLPRGDMKRICSRYSTIKPVALIRDHVDRRCGLRPIASFTAGQGLASRV